MCNMIFEDQRTNVGYEMMKIYNHFGSYRITKVWGGGGGGGSVGER